MEKKKGRRKKTTQPTIHDAKEKTNVMNHERPHNQQRRVDVNKTFLLSCVCPLDRKKKPHEKIVKEIKSRTENIASKKKRDRTLSPHKSISFPQVSIAQSQQNL
jgi:hypothetical protein